MSSTGKDNCRLINYGRKKLLELSKDPFFLPPLANTATHRNLQLIFNASIYSWHAISFWGKDDNASEALNSILGHGANDIEYQFTPKKL